MDETYRMLGRERQADLDREAQKHHLAAVAGPRPVLTDKRPSARRRMLVLLRLKQA